MEFAISQGLPETDGSHLFHTLEAKGWKDVKCWKSTLRKYKSGGWMPSQKGSNGKPATKKDLNDWFVPIVPQQPEQHDETTYEF